MEGRHTCRGVIWPAGPRSLCGQAGRPIAPAARITDVPMLHGLHGDFMADDAEPQTFRGNQFELFGGEPTPAPRSTPDEMRALLHDLLAEARAAETMPWSPDRARFYRGLFPQLSFWLPEDESAQLRFEFETELARLEAA